MSTVYITEENLSSIARDISGAISNTQSLEQFYDFELRSILAAPELKKLSSIKLILESLEHPDVLFKILRLNQQPKIRARKDSKSRWVYLWGSPAYHKNQDCDRLKSEYRNYHIPPQIPVDRVEEYRSYFVENLKKFELRSPESNRASLLGSHSRIPP